MIYFEKRGEQILKSAQKIKGLKYLTDKQAEVFAREKKVDAILATDGVTILMESVHFPTEKEAAAVGEQVIPVGIHAGKKLSEVPELLAATLDPKTYGGV